MSVRRSASAAGGRCVRGSGIGLVALPCMMMSALPAEGLNAEAFLQRAAPALASVRAQEVPDAAQRKALQDALADMRQDGMARHGRRTLFLNWPEPDRTDFFLSAATMGLIDPEGNSQWVAHASVRHHVFPELRRRISSDRDPLLAYASVYPALTAGETNFAVRAVEYLMRTDAFLADAALAAGLQSDSPEWLVAVYTAQGDMAKASAMAARLERVRMRPSPQERGVRDELDSLLDRATAETAQREAGASPETVRACQVAFGAYETDLKGRHPRMAPAYLWEEPFRTDLYVRAVRMVMIGSQSHMRYAINNPPLLRAVHPELKRRMQKDPDAFTVFASLLPAVTGGATDGAADAYEWLRQHDPRLADLALHWTEGGGWLQDHYAERGAEALGTRLREDRMRNLFPGGMQRFDAAAARGAPDAGLRFVSESPATKAYGIAIGDEIVALEGYRVGDLAQYQYIRAQDATNPHMRLVIWDGTAYRSVAVKLENRLFGARLAPFTRDEM